MKAIRSRLAIAAMTGIGVLLAVTGCTTDNSASSSSSSTFSSGASDDKVTLTLANSQWLDALRGKNLWAAVQQYEKSHPNVTLKQEAIPAADFSSKIATELGSGQGADVVMMQDGLFTSEAAAGALLPIDDVAKSASNLNDTSDAGIFDGTQYGMAWQRATYALVYNKTLLEKAGIEDPPTTVDELIADAKQVTASTGAVGFATRSSNSDPNWYLDYENWIDGFGGSTAKDGKVKVNSAADIKAAKQFKKMFDAGILATGDDMTTSRTRFMAGNVAFVMDNSGGTLNMALGGSVDSKNVGVAALPFPNPGAHQQILVSVNKASKHQAAAKKFISWLMTTEGQKALRDGSGPDTLATDVPVTDEFLAANPWASEFPKLAPDSKSLLVKGNEDKTAAIMAPVMDALEQITVSDADPKQALDDAQEAAAAAAK